MKTLSPALTEAFIDTSPGMIKETALSEAPFNSSHCYKDRDLRLHLRIFDIELDDFLEGDRLLVIGSGATRRFERELAEARSDLTIVSVDPLLSHGVAERLRESVRMGAYTSHSNDYGVNFPKELRDGQAYFRPGAVCGGIALAGANREKNNYLPFADNIFQHIVGLHSLPQYCSEHDVPEIMKEVLRVMAPGATARFFPVFPEDEAVIQASDLSDVAASVVLDGEGIHRWHWDGSPGTKRLVLTK